MKHFMSVEDLPAGGLVRVSVSGNCLEGAGILEGDAVGVALDRFPKPPKFGPQGVEREDFCLCRRLDQPGPLLVKRYDGRAFGQPCAGTRYKSSGDRRRVDVSFPVEVLGVVFSLWDERGALKWQQPPDTFPDRLDPGGEIPFWNVSPVKEPRLLEQVTA